MLAMAVVCISIAAADDQDGAAVSAHVGHGTPQDADPSQDSTLRPRASSTYRRQHPRAHTSGPRNQRSSAGPGQPGPDLAVECSMRSVAYDMAMRHPMAKKHATNIATSLELVGVLSLAATLQLRPTRMRLYGLNLLPQHPRSWRVSSTALLLATTSFSCLDSCYFII